MVPVSGPRVAAVMAAYNRKELTLACLRSLRAQRAPGVTLAAAPAAWLSDRIGRLWLSAAGVMLALVTLRWLDVFAGVHLGVPAEQFGNDTAIRVIDGPYAFFLATAAVITLPAWQFHGRRARRLRALSVLLLLYVMLLDRRTVWLALLVGVVVLMLRNYRFGRKALAMLAGAAVAMALVFVVFPGSGSNQEPLARSATSASLLALIALTAGLLRALWRLGRARPDGGLFGLDVLPALVAMQLVWFITWVPGSEQGFVTGLAVAVVAARARARQLLPAALDRGPGWRLAGQRGGERG